MYITHDKIYIICKFDAGGRMETQMEYRVCSFTGHRQIKKEHEKALPCLLGRAIEYAYSKGCRAFLAGGAIGFDTAAAREVIRFRISKPDVRLVLVLPCVDQSRCWSAVQRDAYNHTLECADEVVYISDEYTEGCIKERNRKLAHDADILISYVSRTNSGSAQTVRMARELGKEIYNLYPSLDKNQK